MPHIILKKTFKMRPTGFQVSNEKSYSFHGGSMNKAIISPINAKLAGLHLLATSSRPQFQWDGARGQYRAPINHDCQKYHEEDIVVAILDVMEQMGWAFRFQYDVEAMSSNIAGGSITSRELFIFSKPLGPVLAAATAVAIN
jgi:hypothetical protein